MKKLLFLFLLGSVFYFVYQNKELTPVLNNYVGNEEEKIEFKGKIYIGNENYLKSLKNVGDEDILILDQRYLKNPNIRIYNSYLIDDVSVINYVLDYILEYEKNNPSNWNRTKVSMRREWLLHNMAYKVNYNRGRTKDLDLDNEDEEKFNLI
jgi:hypothetical protein